jgi:hypothetical protein
MNELGTPNESGDISRKLESRDSNSSNNAV